MIRSFIFLLLSANVHAGTIMAPVRGFVAPNVPALPIPASLYSCMTPAQPGMAIGLLNELSQINSEMLRPNSLVYREPLKAALALDGSREFDRMLIGLMPNAEQLQARLRSARTAKDEPQALAILENVEVEYVRAVKSLASVIAKAYERDGMDAQDVRQALAAMEIYTNNGAFAQETMNLMRGLDRAALAAHDEATMAFARAQAWVLQQSLSGELLISAEPLVYAGRANAPLSFYDVETVDQKGASAAERVIENLVPALGKLQPGLGKEIIIARFSTKSNVRSDETRDLLARLKVQIRQKGERSGFKVFFRDEVQDLTVAHNNAAILSVKIIEDAGNLRIFGLRPFPSYIMEVYFVGARRPTPDKLAPVPVPKPFLAPLFSRIFSQPSPWKTRALSALGALGVAGSIILLLDALSGLPIYGQALILAAILLAAAAIAKLLISDKGISSRWKVRIFKAMLLGAGVAAIVGFGRKLMVHTVIGAALLAKLALIFR
jgi:hypothetical protein